MTEGHKVVTEGMAELYTVCSVERRVTDTRPAAHGTSPPDGSVCLRRGTTVKRGARQAHSTAKVLAFSCCNDEGSGTVPLNTHTRLLGTVPGCLF